MENGIRKVNLAEKLNLFSEHWDPKIVATLNGQHVKLVKVEGEFVWHSHDDEDELFMVLKGSLDILFRNPDMTVTLGPGEMVVVPRGVYHKPVATIETHILLFEPMSTVNTGDRPSDRTRGDLEHI